MEAGGGILEEMFSTFSVVGAGDEGLEVVGVAGGEGGIVAEEEAGEASC